MTRTLGVLLVTLALAFGAGAADGTDSKKPEDAQEPAANDYAVLLAKGPAYVEGGPHPGMEEHIMFMKAHHADGVVPVAGALFEEDAAGNRLHSLLYFVRAGSLQEARSLVMKDPLVKQEVARIQSIWVFAAGVGRLGQAPSRSNEGD